MFVVLMSSSTQLLLRPKDAFICFLTVAECTSPELSTVGYWTFPVAAHTWNMSAPTCHVCTLYVFSEVASRLSFSGILSHDLPQRF